MKNVRTAGKLCKQPKAVARKFKTGVKQLRQNFILASDKKWVNGTEIKYLFLKGPDKQKKVVRQAFAHWKSLGIGISFKEVSSKSDSMVRIGFDLSDGSWSYVGREVLTISKTMATMNFGWDLTTAYGMTTALHEIGHTIGFQHEHQSPISGITWDTKAVYTEFSGSPNFWSKAEITANILSKLPANQVQGSAWDPKSIMEYEFGAGLVMAPAKYKVGIFPPGILSANDIKGIKAFYPSEKINSIKKILPHLSNPIKANSGEQNDFLFTATATQKYTFQTKGEQDTVMVIFEKGKKENDYLAGDDDSGLEKNAKIVLPLVKGRKYLINIRVMYAQKNKSGELIIR